MYNQKILDYTSCSHEIKKIKIKLQDIMESKSDCEKTSRFFQNRVVAMSSPNDDSFYKDLVPYIRSNDRQIEAVLSAMQCVKAFTEKLSKDNGLSYDNHQIELERNTELQNVIADLCHHIAQRERKFDLKKRSVLRNCQQATDEQFKCQFDKLKHELSSTRSKLDLRKFHQARTSDEHSLEEIRLQKNCINKFEEELGTITDQVRTDKKQWEAIMQSDMEKDLVDFKISLRQTIESELKQESQRNIEMMVSQAKLSYLKELKLSRQAKIGNILADAKKQWKKEHERDIPQLTKNRKLSESEVSSKHKQLRECEKQLVLMVSKMDRVKKLVDS